MAARFDPHRRSLFVPDRISAVGGSSRTQGQMAAERGGPCPVLVRLWIRVPTSGIPVRSEGFGLIPMQQKELEKEIVFTSLSYMSPFAVVFVEDNCANIYETFGNVT